MTLFAFTRPLVQEIEIVTNTLHKAHMPRSNTTRIWTPMFELYVVRSDSKNDYQKDVVYIRNQTTCSKHYRFNNPQNWEGLYDQYMSMRTFSLIMNKIFI